IRRNLHHLVGKALITCSVRVVVDAVQQKVVNRTSQAVDIKRRFTTGAADTIEGRLPHTRRQQSKVRRRATIEWQRNNLLLLYHLTAFARISLQHTRRISYCHSLDRTRDLKS